MSDEKKSPFQRPGAARRGPFSDLPQASVGKYGLTPFEDRKYRFQPENPDKPEYFQVACAKGEVVVQTHGGEIVDPDIARSIAYDILRTVDKVVYVYAGISSTKRMCKIGMTQDVERRALELGIEVFHSIPCERFGKYSARNIERTLHDFLKSMDVYCEGEWFVLSKALVQLIYRFKTGKDVIDTTQMLIEFDAGLPIKFSDSLDIEQAQAALQVLYSQTEVSKLLVVVHNIEYLVRAYRKDQLQLAYSLWLATSSYLDAQWGWEGDWKWPYGAISTSGSGQLPSGENDS